MDIRAKKRVLHLVSVCVVLVAGVVWSVPATAQALGELKGRITDSSGAAIGAADITLTLSASDVSQTTKTTDAGDYVFSQLTPAIYSIHVSHPKFAPLDREGVTVKPGQTVRMDITLKVVEVGKMMTMLASSTTTFVISTGGQRSGVLLKVNDEERVRKSFSPNENDTHGSFRSHV